MNDDEIRMRLRGMGKGCFVLDYHIFADNNLSSSQKHDALRRAVRERGECFTENSIRSRVSKATKIINEGAAQRALHIILSARVKGDVIDKAQALLNKLSAAK